MAAGDVIWSDGTEIILETAASSASITNGAVRECDSDNLQPADVSGNALGRFEFDTAAGGFSAAPTAGARIDIYEQKINSDANDAPDVATTYLHDWIGAFNVAPSDVQQYLETLCPINKTGGKFWIYWRDGGAGTASIDAGWELRVIPTTSNTE